MKELKTLFALLRLGLGTGKAPPPPSAAPPDWDKLFALSARQGTVLLAWGGIQYLPAEDQPPRRLRLRWVANVVKGNERWSRYREVVTSLSRTMTRAGFDMVVVKGLSVSALYPVPWYREGGDVDIYLFGAADRADAMMRSQGVPVNHPIAKHSVFPFDGVTVENHRRFFDTESLFVREAKLCRRMERLLTGMFTPADCPPMDGVEARELPVQAAALYLVGHTFRHFCGNDLNARHLCDWTVFFTRRAAEIDFGLLERQIDELGLRRFATLIGSFCREHLGFSPPFCDGPGERRGARLLMRVIARYRLTPRVHIPVLGVLRHIFLRNHIYNRYMAPIAPSEFLLPEIRRYFVWLAGRLKGTAR